MATYETDDAFDLEKVSMAGVSDLKKLREWLEESRTAKVEAHKRITFLVKEWRKWNEILRRAQAQTRKLSRKVKNLEKVQSTEFELNEWYVYEKSSGLKNYYYPIRVTPAGRVLCYHITWVGERSWENGNYWNVYKYFTDSNDLKKSSRLGVLIDSGEGDLNKLMDICKDIRNSSWEGRKFRKVEGKYIELS